MKEFIEHIKESQEEINTPSEMVEITSELVSELLSTIPELEGVDSDMLFRGMQVEIEHAATVGNDINMVAKIAADHIKEFPGQDYYAALEEMEQTLKG